MASKVGYSANVGLPEMIGIVKEFERSNSVCIGLSAFLVEGARTDWEFAMSAWEPSKMDEPGAVPLALVSARCMGSRLVTMEALLFQLLYALDFQLALLELQGTGETK